MPLYEYFCNTCERAFEALIPLSASKEPTQACRRCGGPAHRILSAVNIAAERAGNRGAENCSRDTGSDVTRLTLPPSARLCWMDDRAASRLAAYKAGRGAEFDDTIAARCEVAQARGEEVGTSSVQHSHSPLSDPAVFANRRKAAQEKVAESAALKPPTRAGEAGGS